MHTTLNKLESVYFDNLPYGTVKKLYQFLNKTQPDDEPLEILTVLEALNTEPALRCISGVDHMKYEKEIMQVALALASEASEFMPKTALEWLDAIKSYVEGNLSKENLYEWERSASDFLKSSSGYYLPEKARVSAEMAFMAFNDPWYPYKHLLKLFSLTDRVTPHQEIKSKLREILKNTSK